MVVVTLFSHRTIAMLRGPSAQRDILMRIFKMLVVLYIVGTLGLLGAVAGGVITLLEPGADPAAWMGRGWLLLGSGYGLLRMFMEQSASLHAQPYLALPVPRAALVRFVLGTALLSAWNLVPLAFWIPFWVRSVLPAHTTIGALAYGIGVLTGLGIITHLVPCVRRYLGERPLPVLISGSVLLGGMGVMVWAKSEWANAVGWIADGLLQAQLWPLLVAIAGYLGALALHRRQLWRLLDLDEGTPRSRVSRRSAGNVGLIRWVEKREKIGALLALELRLIARNTQPRQIAFTVLLFPLLVTVGAWLFGTGTWTLDLNELHTSYLSLGLFPISVFAIGHGQFMFSWEGVCLEGLLTHHLSVCDIHRAKLALLWGFTLALFVLSLPALLIWPSTFLWLQAAFLSYTMGFGVPMVLYAAHFNIKAAPANDSGIGFVNLSGPRALCVIGLLFAPAIPFFWSGSVWVYLWSVAAIGLASAACLPLWMRLMHRTWQRRRHRMLAGFRDSAP